MYRDLKNCNRILSIKRRLAHYKFVVFSKPIREQEIEKLTQIFKETYLLEKKIYDCALTLLITYVCVD